MSFYCKIFIDIEIEKSALDHLICMIINGRMDRFTIVCAWAEIDLRTNADWEPGRVEEQDGFLYSRYFADIDSFDNVSEELYVEQIARLVRQLRRQDGLAVPACDFEKEIAARV